MSVHQVEPRQLSLLAIFTIDVGLVAEAGIYDLLSRPLVSTELAAALTRCLRRRRRASQHIFAIECILNITATTSAEIFAALFALLALARPRTPFTRYVRNTITNG